MSEERRELRWVRVGELLEHAPFPARGEVTAMDALVSSVKVQGVICPILARPVRLLGADHREGAGAGESRASDPGGLADGLQVVCGYRRVLAARAAGLSVVPALVEPLEDLAAIRCYLSENTLRADLTPEARESVLELLKRLRDGLPRGGAPSDAGALGARSFAEGAWMDAAACARPASAQSSRRADLWREGAADSVRSEPASGRAGRLDRALWPTFAPTGPSRGAHMALGKLVRRAEELLERVHRRKAVDLPQAQEAVRELFRLAPADRSLRADEIYCAETRTWLAEHSLLCASLCFWLAPSGSPNDVKERYALAGFLHDVGMVFLDKPYLGEPRAMSPGQRAEVQSHTRIGFALIASTADGDPYVAEIAEAARDHHERHNGTGYPSGAPGDAVSRLSRVMALVDTYASLIGPRPHRDSLAPEVALARLGSATELGLYDPELYCSLSEAVRTASLAMAIEAAGTGLARVEAAFAVPAGH